MQSHPSPDLPQHEMSMPLWPRAVALGLFSAVLFVIELGFTRLFATRYYPPLVFVILSCAMLGLGLGAAWATWRPRWRSMAHVPRYVAGVGVSTVLLLFVVTVSNTFAILLPLAILPFFWAGLGLATLFAQDSRHSNTLYFADLVGAAVGILLVTPLFNAIGLPRGMATAILLLGGVGLLFQRYGHPVVPITTRQHSAALLPLAILFCSGFAALLWAIIWTPTASQLFADKPIADKLQAGGQILTTHWDNFARTDLLDPGGGLPYEIYLDGAAGSVMPPAAGHRSFLQDIGFFPFATEQPERVFVIGPGGGLDLWFAQQSGAEEIVGVEVNPATVELLNTYAAYNGDLPQQRAIRLLTDEGRSVLTREGRHYDLIFLSQVVTLAAERNGFALVENNAYTVEAFAAYLSHLRPDGIVALKLYDELTLTRALTTVLQVLQGYGLSVPEALNQVIILLDPQHEPAIPLLIVRNTPYTRDDVLSIGAVANTVGFQPFFLPGLWAEAPLDTLYTGERTLSSIIAESASDIKPTTDARPFFFSFGRGIPTDLQPMLLVVGLVVLGGLGLIRRVPSQLSSRHQYRYIGYFAAIGMGFMLIEIVLIQQTQRFLGHPTTALTVVLAALLVGAGLGSWLGGRWWSTHFAADPDLASPENMPALPRWPFAGILVWWAGWLVLWPYLSAYYLPFALPWRIGAVVAYLLPLALLMGMPFAFGLRTVAHAGDNQVALAWAVNGVASVVGTMLALVVALLLGYGFVALVGWLCYLAALIFSGSQNLNYPRSGTKFH